MKSGECARHTRPASITIWTRSFEISKSKNRRAAASTFRLLRARLRRNRSRHRLETAFRLKYHGEAARQEPRPPELPYSSGTNGCWVGQESFLGTRKKKFVVLGCHAHGFAWAWGGGDNQESILTY